MTITDLGRVHLFCTVPGPDRATPLLYRPLSGLRAAAGAPWCV